MGDKQLLGSSVAAALGDMVPAIARRAHEALVDEIPGYRPGARRADDDVEAAIRVAFTGLVRLIEQSTETNPAAPASGTLEAAYAFGQYEAGQGRTMDSLLAAYRISLRVAWHDLATEMVHREVPAMTIVGVAELVIAYIDQLSAASIAGHADELASVGRAHEQHVERLTRRLLDGAPAEELAALADTAGWLPPATLTAVILPAAHIRPTLQHLDHGTLTVPADIAAGAPESSAVLLVPDVHRDRTAVLRALRHHSAVLGPCRPWAGVATSYRRALQAHRLVPPNTDEPVDTDEHLVELIVGVDHEMLDDLRARALAPLRGLRPATANRLAETLRSWLLHQGRRDDVAADLNVHPQTVRYRMGQLRNIFQEQLETPQGVLELLIALATLPRTQPEAQGSGSPGIEYTT